MVKGRAMTRDDFVGNSSASDFVSKHQFASQFEKKKMSVSPCFCHISILSFEALLKSRSWSFTETSIGVLLTRWGRGLIHRRFLKPMLEFPFRNSSSNPRRNRKRKLEALFPSLYEAIFRSFVSSSFCLSHRGRCEDCTGGSSVSPCLIQGFNIQGLSSAVKLIMDH